MPFFGCKNTLSAPLVAIPKEPERSWKPFHQLHSSWIATHSSACDDQWLDNTRSTQKPTSTHFLFLSVAWKEDSRSSPCRHLPEEQIHLCTLEFTATTMALLSLIKRLDWDSAKVSSSFCFKNYYFWNGVLQLAALDFQVWRATA